MITFFKIIVFQPIFNLLVIIYTYASFNDFGIAVILLTILIRILLYPLFYHGIKSQTMMQRIQPQMQQIQHEHKDNREKQAQKLLELYKTHKVNPFSGFFFLLLQLPILISLYYAFLKGLSPEMMENLYYFIPKPESVNYHFLGLIDLQKSNIILVSLAAALQYVQGKLALAKKQSKLQTQQIAMQNTMLYVGPIITLVIFFNFPAAVSLYWIVTTIFSIFQQIIINKKLQHGHTLDITTNTSAARVQ